MSDEKEAIEPLEEATPGTDGNEALAGEVSEEKSESDEPVGSDEDLMRQLDDARLEAKGNWEKVLRLQAEMDNLRRRTEKELQNAHKFALDRFARELLPIIDSLELGVQAASAEGAEVEKLKEGGELTLQLFVAALEKFGIAELNPVGEVFNPDLHQAMAMEASEKHEPNTVIKVFQKGYLLNERLIRPAMVVVAQAAKPVKIDEQA